MSRFLTLIPYLAAQKILKKSAIPGCHVQSVPVRKSHGFISHEPVYSKLTVPQSAVSQRDGYVIICAETLNVTESKPVHLSSYIQVHTGSPVPEGYDAVIMQEDVRIDDTGTLTILKPTRPWQHIQKAGSEIRTGKMIIPAGHLITPDDVGALVSYGIITIQVRILTVGIIPTGDELKEPCTAPGPGEVIASNGSMLAAYLNDLGIKSREYPITPDDPKKIKAVIEQAVRDCNVVMISGGSSTGKRDHTYDVLSSLGTILYHGIAIRPGRTTLAAVVDEIPVFGLPGTPVGAQTVLRELIIPWLQDSGYPVQHKKTLQAILAESVPSELGTDDFVPIVVGKVRDTYRAVPVPRGSGQLAAVRSNGILHIARNSEGLKQEKECQVTLTRISPHPDNILLFSGIYDPILDYLDQFLRARDIRLYFKQTNIEITLLSIQNRNFHGGIISRPIVGNTIQSPDLTNLTEKAYAVTVATREYILAARIFPESGTLSNYSCPALPNNSFLRGIMEEYFDINQVPTERIIRLEPVSTNEEEIIQRIKNGDVDFGPCSGYLAAEYDLYGPVIGKKSIDLIFREEDQATEQIIHLREILASNAWEEEISRIPGYSAKRSGQVSMLSQEK